jgi:hypothetical protein
MADVHFYLKPSDKPRLANEVDAVLETIGAINRLLALVDGMTVMRPRCSAPPVAWSATFSVLFAIELAPARRESPQ